MNPLNLNGKCYIFLQKGLRFLIMSMIFSFLSGSIHEMSDETIPAFAIIKGWLWCLPTRSKGPLNIPNFLLGIRPASR